MSGAQLPNASSIGGFPICQQNEAPLHKSAEVGPRHARSVFPVAGSVAGNDPARIDLDLAGLGNKNLITHIALPVSPSGSQAGDGGLPSGEAGRLIPGDAA